MVKQGTTEWLMQRVGKITASRIADIMAKGAGRKTYLTQIVTERLTQLPTASHLSQAMQHGIDTEPMARTAYEVDKGVLVIETGMIQHPKLDFAGASPDGLVGEHGLIEIKCPNSATHLDTLLGGEIPKKYMLQMQWQMECTSRLWCDFVSFDNRMPAHLQMYVKRVEADYDLIDEITAEVIDFNNEANAILDKLKD